MSTELVGKLSTEVIIPDSVKVGLKSSMLSVEGPLGKACLLYTSPSPRD